MSFKILVAFLTFLKEMIVDNDRIKLFARRERNEFTLLLALAFIFMSFLWYYTQTDRLWYINRELEARLIHQAEIIESAASDALVSNKRIDLLILQLTRDGKTITLEADLRPTEETD